MRGCVSPQLLHERFPQIKGAYTQQALDYGKNSRYGDRWKISCYIVVLEKWKPKIMPHEPMVEALSDVVDVLSKVGFEAWYLERFEREVTSSVGDERVCYGTGPDRTRRS